MSDRIWLLLFVPLGGYLLMIGILTLRQREYRGRSGGLISAAEAPISFHIVVLSFLGAGVAVLVLAVLALFD